MATGQFWKPGSFTKNFSWGPPANGLKQLHESIRVGFAGKMEDVPRSEFRARVSNLGHSEYIPINFFLFNRTVGAQDFIVADELVFQALTFPHSKSFDKLAVFALNFAFAGKWSGAEAAQRRPALWAFYYIRDRVAEQFNWDTKKVTADDIQRFVEGSAQYRAKSARKLSTNLKYLYEIGGLAAFASKRVERWWVDSLFLALDRIIEDRRLDGPNAVLREEDYGPALAREGFPAISGARSVEKDLASSHLVRLYTACGGRDRFSEEHVRDRTMLKLPDLENVAWPNDPSPQGALHPTNPRILKSIPRVCAMLARYAGFEIIDSDELENFDLDDFIKRHTQHALDRIRQDGIVPSMSAEELMKLTRDR